MNEEPKTYIVTDSKTLAICKFIEEFLIANTSGPGEACNILVNVLWRIDYENRIDSATIEAMISIVSHQLRECELHEESKHAVSN